MRNRLYLFCLAILLTWSASAQRTDYPQLGAQVFIEPGQTKEQIDGLFRTLKENNMTVARIRLFGSHIMRDPAKPDFTLYDMAFDAAERYGIKVFATLFPETDELNDVGGFKFPSSEEHLSQVDNYVKVVVEHFSTKPALYTWVLQNEPGLGRMMVARTPLSMKIRKEWEENTGSYERPSGFLAANFDEAYFSRYYMVWYLTHLADQVKKYDSQGHYTHINPHALMDTLADYDFEALEQILTSLGVSMHFSWHFSFFDPEDYADGVLMMCDLIREGAGKNPFWVTEMQGGGVTASGKEPISPTGDQTTQWLWSSISSGAEGIIFWTLNPRMSVKEAGEWAMIDYLGNPSERLVAASKVAASAREHASLLSRAKPFRSPVAILYNNESFLVQANASPAESDKYVGRTKGAVIRAAIGAFEALESQGIKAELKCMDSFDWDILRHSVVILPHSLCIPERFYDEIRRYVESGGTVLCTGLSGYFNEKMQCSFIGGHPLADVMGANLLEFKVIDNLFPYSLDSVHKTVKSHLWRGSLEPVTAKPLSSDSDVVTACENSFGKGRFIWIPTPLELGGDVKDLGELYRSILRTELESYPSVIEPYSNTALTVNMMDCGDSLLCVVTNASQDVAKLKLGKPYRGSYTSIFGEGRKKGSHVIVPANGTEVFTVAKIQERTPSSLERVGHSDKQWKLVFEENFDGPQVDRTVWNIYEGPGHNRHGYRKAEAFSVEDGYLVITARMKDGKIVSGGMAHRENYLPATRFEFRARCERDTSCTMSGVVLTWPQSDIWPDEGEMDIFETLCQDPRQPIHTFLHYGSDNSQVHQEYDIDGTRWQEMALEWFEDVIYIYLNGELVYTVKDRDVIARWPHHICLQLDAFKHFLPETVKMYVDYVRIYK